VLNVLLYNISYFVFGVPVVLRISVWLASVKKALAVSSLVLLYIGNAAALASDSAGEGQAIEQVELRLLVSVRPLALIAKAVAGDRAAVDVLVKAGQSPHHFSLRASDRQRIAAADLVLWVGPELERFLVKPLRSAASSMTATDEAEATEIDHANKELGDPELSPQEHSHGGSSHPWLAPDAAIHLAQRLAIKLAQLDPTSAASYHSNAEAFSLRIEHLDQVIKASLADSQRAYAVAHDAYRSFSEHYQLPEPIVLSVSPEVSPGARKLWQLQSQLPQQSCVLVELEHQSRWLKALVETQQLRLHAVDTLAYGAGITSYADFLTNMSETFQACLD